MFNDRYLRQLIAAAHFEFVPNSELFPVHCDQDVLAH